MDFVIFWRTIERVDFVSFWRNCERMSFVSSVLGVPVNVWFRQLWRTCELWISSVFGVPVNV